MSKEKPGIVRRFFRFIGALLTGIRWLFTLLVTLIMLGFLLTLFGKGVKPLPEQAALVLTPSGRLVEERSYSDPLAQFMQQSTARDAETPVRDLVDVIDAAADDKRITALVLKLDYLAGGGLTKLQTVGDALARFKQSGKPLVAVGDNFTQEQYFLASYADDIHLHPMGAVLVTGYGYFGAYFERALDKLNINLNVYRAGPYKSAVEPFTRNDMSELARENARAWLQPLWQAYTEAVEKRRELAPGSLDDYANTLDERLQAAGGDLARAALDAGLIDHVSSRPAMESRLQALAGKRNGGYRHVDFKHYLAHVRLPGIDEPKAEGNIGVIVAAGTILDGEQPAGAIGGDSLAKLLERAGRDSSLDALVLRIDSPGGSAFASEVIRDQLLATQEKLPVYVSMGSMAASGGYWVAAGAQEIWAMPTTLTGSIGVFGIIPTFEETLDSLGINNDGVGTTELAGLYRLDRKLSPQADAIFRASIQGIYDKFLGIVAQGRDMPRQQVEQVAGGRVWTGAQAKERGLVDHLGTLQDTIAAAAKNAGLETWQVKRIEAPLSFREQLLKQLSGGAARMVGTAFDVSGLPAPVLAQLRQSSRQWRALAQLNDPRGVYLQCLACPAQ